MAITQEFTRYKVWDPVVRLFHWSLVVAFGANAFLTDAESKLHDYIGYMVVGLVGLRIVWGLVGTRHARFRDFPPSVQGATQQMTQIATGRTKVHLGHTPLGALMIYNLLGSMLAIGLTGFMMTTDAYWGVAWVEDLHELVVSWAEVSVVLHVAAVIWESHRTGVNLPGAMVTGNKDVPDDAVIEGRA